MQRFSRVAQRLSKAALTKGTASSLPERGSVTFIGAPRSPPPPRATSGSPHTQAHR